MASNAAAHADTFPKLLDPQCPPLWRAAGLPAQGSRHLAGVDLERGAGGGARLCGRALPPRAQARRHHRHRRLQPAEALLVGDGRADARRRAGAGLCRRGRRRARLCAGACRGALRRGRGPGAGRQDPVGIGAAARSSSRSSTTSRAGCATTTTAACTRSTTSSRTAVQRWRKTLPPAPWLDREIESGKGSDPSIILYTSGTTGQSKGVVLSAIGCINAASDTVAFDKLTERDEALAYLPLAWVGDHYLNYAQALVAGFLPRLSGERRDRDAGHEGDRPDLLFRAAARVRADAHPRDDPHGGRGPAQAARVPLFHRRGAPPRREDPQPRAGAARRPPALRARRTSGLRPAQERARPLARARSPTRRARRSAPTSSRSTARSA